ncbi:histidine ammonia-lyase [Hoylesella buccalis]|uniref:histidine ammonia-lyase n=1 Tax=Hoylesella buccalis TaxID=28127 RepID=UPI001D096BA4|nr:histidine ammonia-lyase [Hoylesella buccalis]MCB6900944.1 histidine ammonia-lyase [Hoylesella buccalis]UEA62616.1 histidine ammonia-lyase [Hoylesella buccalis]UWP50098.1 histidine ammonia-lyase [Hoylesella buccalis ATCC 35310]
MIHKISAAHLTIEEVGAILENHATLELSDDARQRIVRCRKYLDKKIAESDVPIYGVTTGFGSLCNVSVDKDRLAQLQVNLIMSHACGVGSRVPNDIVKIMLFLKAQSLSYGYSGCQVETVERLIDFFNNDIYPVVYTQGSLGASGDLVPLAHLCLPLLGMGEVEYKGERMSGKALLQKMNWEPIQLASKEGLALLNGTQNMNAYAVWAVLQSERLCDWADKIGVMSLEAYDGRIEPFTHAVHAVRPHKGQIDTAAHIRELLEGSELIKQPKVNVQDPYSFRCMPQVHGASKDTLAYVRSVIEIELNAATDNPTVCPDDDLVISAGNFHGEPIAQPMDFLAIALCELSNISERRIYKLISGTRNLPSFLVAKPGLNSGFMIPQYAAASIVSQSKMYCTPASVDSIPSSQGQEDHVSMGANAATKLYQVVLNTERVLAIELFNAAQALEFRRPLKSSPAIEAIYAAYRKVVPFIENDEFMSPHIAQSVEFLRK